MSWSNTLKGTGMFRNMDDEQRSKIDRSLEHHRILECEPFTHEDTNYIIVVFDIEDDGDCIKKSFGLFDDEGIPIRTPFCPSPYSGAQEIRDWIEEGKPDDKSFQVNNTKRRIKLAEEERKERYGE
jgi:hypothetical protein